MVEDHKTLSELKVDLGSTLLWKNNSICKHIKLFKKKFYAHYT